MLLYVATSLFWEFQSLWKDYFLYSLFISYGLISYLWNALSGRPTSPSLVGPRVLECMAAHIEMDEFLIGDLCWEWDLFYFTKTQKYIDEHF